MQLRKYQERRRGFWPDDAPGNLVNAAKVPMPARRRDDMARTEQLTARGPSPGGAFWFLPVTAVRPEPSRNGRSAMHDSHVLAALGFRPTTLFNGFPYLVTRVVPVMYHIIVLPEELNAVDLVEIARRQARATALETCLVLAAD